MSKPDAPPPGGKRTDKSEVPPPEGKREIETPPRKGRPMHETLSLEGEREHAMMPRESPRKGVPITLKGTKCPGILTVKHEVDVPPQELRVVSCSGACMYGCTIRFCGTGVNQKPGNR
jgi:hypothetical protein